MTVASIILIYQGPPSISELTHQFSSVITKEGNTYVAVCPELDIASQGGSVEEALVNLKEAISLYLEDEDAEYDVPDFRPLVTLIEVE